MNVRTLFRNLPDTLESVDDVRRLGESLGDELPADRPDVVRAFRARLARLSSSDAVAKGYLMALTDVASATDAVFRKREREARMVQAAMKPEIRALLIALADGPALGKELAERVGGKDASRVSKLLAALREAHLVEVFSTATDDKRARPQRLTALGRRVAHVVGAARAAERVGSGAAPMTKTKAGKRSRTLGEVLPDVRRPASSTGVAGGASSVALAAEDAE